MTESTGLRCPKCHSKYVPQQGRSVYYTRHGERSILRRRICAHCGKKFSTVERVVGEIIPTENSGASSTGGTV